VSNSCPSDRPRIAGSLEAADKFFATDRFDKLLAVGAFGRREILELGCALLVGAGMLYLLSPFLTDDAFISLRYAKHLAAGHGIVWNIGEDPVEGYSNFLHVLLGAAAIRLDLVPIRFLRLVNMVAVLGAIVVVYEMTRESTRQRGLPLLAALLLALHAPMAYWAASGLETGLYTSLGVLAVYLVLRPSKIAIIASGFVFVLVALVRPEGPLFFAVAFLVLGASTLAGDGTFEERLRDAFRRYWPAALIFIGCYAAYFAWRMNYFGYLLPNSVYYKEDAVEKETWRLLEEFGRQNWVMLTLLVLVPFRRLGARGFIPLGLLTAYAVILYDVTPSVAYYHRFFLPVVPFIIFLAVTAIDGVCERQSSERAKSVAAWLLAGILMSWSLFNPKTGPLAVQYNTNHMLERIKMRARTADYLQAGFDEDAVIVACDVGIIGYLLPNPILDGFGLNSESYVHLFDRQRRVYAFAIAKEEPEAVVLTSRKQDEFDARYATDGYFHWALGAVGGYTPIHSVPTARPDYGYWIFARQELAPWSSGSGALRFRESASDLPAHLEQMRRQIEND
jgi:hypothetical protein